MSTSTEVRTVSASGGEKWRSAPDWPEYEVSSRGRVRRVAPALGAKVGRVRRLGVGDTGYATVGLSGNGRRRTIKVHRLVARAFLGEPPFEGAEVCHNNGDRLDNRVTNLRYDTRSANLADRIDHGTAQRGERANGARLTEADVHVIRTSGQSARHLASTLGVAPRTVRDVINGKTWAWLAQNGAA